MAIELIQEVFYYAPDTLTPRERYVLVVMAESADAKSRKPWPSYEGNGARDAEFRRATRCSRSQYYATIKALIEKGVVEVVQRGQKHRRAEYRIAQLRPAHSDAPSLSVPENGTLSGSDSASQEPGPRERVSIPQTGTLTTPQHPGFGSQHPGFDVSGSRFGALSVPETGTPSPQSSVTPNSSSPLDLVRAERVFKPDEDEEDFIRWMINRFRPKSLNWWQTIIANGSLQQRVDEWRAERVPAAAPPAIGAPSEATRSPAARPVAETLSSLSNGVPIVRADESRHVALIRAQLAESKQRSHAGHGRGLVALGDVLPPVSATPEGGATDDGGGEAATAQEDVDADDPVEQY